MKKRKFAKRTAYSIIAGATLASAAFLPGCNRPESVYGPPPGATTQAQEESSFQSQTSAQEQTTEISSEYDTTENIPETVYGPPEDFGLPPEDGEEPPEVRLCALLKGTVRERLQRHAVNLRLDGIVPVKEIGRAHV